MTSRATASDLVAGIEPRSLPHGERANLEANLPGALAAPTGAPNPAAAGAAVQSAQLPGVEDPLAMLANGDVTLPAPEGPVTAGLSVGPGPGPLQEQQDPRVVRLQQIATEASTPLLRAAARAELRRITGERL